MKAIIITALMALGLNAFAYTVEYGPGAYTKTTKVCYGKNDTDCKNMTYKYYAPRMERVCYGEKEGNQKCFNRRTTGNWGSIKFSSRKEAQEWYRDNGSRP